MRTWTKEQEQFLIDNGDKMSVKDLMNALDKTDGAIRNKKSSLGIKNNRSLIYTQEEKDIIKDWYILHLESDEGGIELDKLSKILGRSKTYICAIAGEMGLTYYGNYSKEDRKNRGIKMSTFNEKYSPSRFSGKHHSLKSKRQMSIKQRIRFENMSEEEKKDYISKGILTKRQNNIYTTTENSYSRCRGGYREDLNKYFRSSWEANIARYLNFLHIKWEYEFKRFNFEEIDSGVLSYMPDFYLSELDIWIEVKGWMDEKSKTRFKYFEKFYPEENNKLILIERKRYNEIEKEFKYIVSNWEFSNQNKKKIS